MLVRIAPFYRLVKLFAEASLEAVCKGVRSQTREEKADKVAW